MTSFEMLRIKMYKELEDFDDNHPLWDIWQQIYKAEEYVHNLEKVVEAARRASKAIDNYYLKDITHDPDLWFARDEIDQALKELEGGET